MSERKDVLPQTPPAVQKIAQLARDLAEHSILTIESRSAVDELFRAILGIVVGSLTRELHLPDNACKESPPSPHQVRGDIPSALNGLGKDWMWINPTPRDRRPGPRERWSEVVRLTIGNDINPTSSPGIHGIVSENGVRRLGAAISTFARELSEDVEPQDEDTYVQLLALHSAVFASLCKLATIWNGNHDRSLRLPPEIRVRCFSWLPIWTMFQLCNVSSHWRDTVIRWPSPWATIDCRRIPIDKLNVNLEAAIFRSGVLPLDIFDLSVVRASDIPRIDRCLRACGHRLRRLGISVPLFPQENAGLFRYAAPRLEELSLSDANRQDPWGTQHRLSHLFDGCAPRLRLVDLTISNIPPHCPALDSVTSATIRSCTDGLSNVFALMPNLQRLQLINCYLSSRAALPSNHRLTAIEIDGYVSDIDIPMLEELGYTKVSTFTLSTTWEAERLHKAFSLSREVPHGLEVRADGGLVFLLSLEGGGTLRCVVSDCTPADIRRVLRDSAATAGIRRLVVRREAEVNDGFQTLPALSLDLPDPRTLVLECGPTRLQELLRRRTLRHSFRAPALARVELVPGGLLDGYAAPVDAECLLSLLAEEFEHHDRATLEIFVDTARGVRLEGDVELLRQAVSKLSI